MLTYKQAYDKIIEAYFKNEIKPLDPSFCFCGTLNHNAPFYWRGWGSKANGFHYDGSQLQRLEDALIGTISRQLDIDIYEMISEDLEKEYNYEDALFNGMSAALDVLKKIHRERGENVDELPALTKRVLV